MKLRIDRAKDVVYLYIDESRIVESDEVQPGVILDYDVAGRVVGVEVLGAASLASGANLSTLVFETA